MRQKQYLLNLNVLQLYVHTITVTHELSSFSIEPRQGVTLNNV